MSEPKDADLENAIDEVGREKVFRRARELGWSGGDPPKWVWWGIVTEMLQAPKDNVAILPVVRVERL